MISYAFLITLLSFPQTHASSNSFVVNVTPPDELGPIYEDHKAAAVLCWQNNSLFISADCRANSTESSVFEGYSDINSSDSGDGSKCVHLNFTTKILGYTYYKCQFNWSDYNTAYPNSNSYRVTVVKYHNFIENSFEYLITIMVVLINIAFGTEVRIATLRSIMRRPIPLFIASFCQFFVLPPIGVIIAKYLRLQTDMAFGLLLIACAPGGGNSNIVAFLVGGELGLSITMTFFSTALAIVMMPVNIYVYSRFVREETFIAASDLPYFELCVTLITLSIPVAIGMYLIHKYPETTKRLLKFGIPALLLVFLGVVIVGSYRTRYATYFFSFRILAACALVPIIGITIGVTLCLVSNLRISQIKTTIFEIALQNSAIVITIAQITFDQPEADLAAIVPIAYAMMSGFLLATFITSHFILKCASQKYRDVLVSNKASMLEEEQRFSFKLHAVGVAEET